MTTPRINWPCLACGGSAAAVMSVATDSFQHDLATLGLRCDSCGARSDVRVPYALLAQYLLTEPAPDAAPGPSLRALDGSVIGYRAFRIRGWQLIGTGQSVSWEPGVNEAKCASFLPFVFAGSHPAPAPDCQCGLYALARFDEGKAWWQNADVLGAVEAWADPTPDNSDRFFVHSTGFRAQYAKVVLLATSDEYPRAKNAAIRALAAEHGADVCRAEHLEDAAKEHGQLVPDEWLEWAREDESPTGIAGFGRGIAGFGPITAQLTAQLPRQQPLTSRSCWAVSSAKTAPRPSRPKGVSRTIGHPGPPGIGKYRKHARVHDSKGVVWRCTRGGQPGVWERDEDDG